jgi:hypothetical protein
MLRNVVTISVRLRLVHVVRRFSYCRFYLLYRQSLPWSLRFRARSIPGRCAGHYGCHRTFSALFLESIKR